MKNRIAKAMALLLVVMAVLSCLPDQARAEEETYTEAQLYELQVRQRADALYASIKEEHDGSFVNYIDSLRQSKDFYEARLRDVKYYTQATDLIVDITTTLLSSAMGIIVGGVAKELNITSMSADDQDVMDLMDYASQYVDVAFGELELPLPTVISADEYIFRQAKAGSDRMVINDLRTVMSRVESNDGHFDSFEHAAEFIYYVEWNKLGLAALRMGKAQFDDILSLPPGVYLMEAAKDFLISDVLSKMPLPSLITPEMRAQVYTYIWDSTVAIIQSMNNENLNNYQAEAEAIINEMKALLKYDPENPPELPRYQTVTLVYDKENSIPRKDTVTVQMGYGYWSLPWPYRFGYTFSGWHDSPEGGKEYDLGDICQTDEPLTLYGEFTHAVTLNGSCGPDLRYTLYKDGILEITGTGDMTSAPWTENDATRGLVAQAILPEGLTSICDSAFESCGYMHSISLPRSLRRIGDYAFKESGLTALELPDGLTHLGAGVLMDAEHVTELTIPASVNSVGYLSVFETSEEPYDNSAYDYHCGPLTYSKVERLTFAPGRTRLPDFVCCNMPELSSVSIPGSVREIGSYALYGCPSLASVSLPDGITTIGDHAFAGYYSTVVIKSAPTDGESETSWDGPVFTKNMFSGFETLTLPPSVVSLGSYLLSGNSHIVDLTIPASVTSAADILCESDVERVTLAHGTTRICDYMFREAPYLSEVNIPNTVTEIGVSAFQYDFYLKNIAIPDSVRRIESLAFANTGLDALVLPEGLTYLGDSVLANNFNIYELTLPGSLGTVTLDSITGKNCLTDSSVNYLTLGEGITRIDDWALSRLYSLCSIVFPSTMQSIGDYAFYDDDQLSYCYDANPFIEVGQHAFTGTSVMPEMVVDKNEITLDTVVNTTAEVNFLVLAHERVTGAESLNAYTGDDVVNLDYTPGQKGVIRVTALSAGSVGVEYVAEGGNSNWLFNVTVVDDAVLRLPDGLRRVEAEAFRGSPAKEVCLPEGVEFIGAYAFADMERLETVRIPTSVVTIEEGAFDNCPNIHFSLASGCEAGWLYANAHDIPLITE